MGFREFQGVSGGVKGCSGFWGSSGSRAFMAFKGL